MPLREELQQALGNKYVLERELAGGGMARIFVANDVRLGRQIVVKTIAPELVGSLNAERFQREIAIAAKTDECGLVRWAMPKNAEVTRSAAVVPIHSSTARKSTPRKAISSAVAMKNPPKSVIKIDEALACARPSNFQ